MVGERINTMRKFKLNIDQGHSDKAMDDIQLLTQALDDARSLKNEADEEEILGQLGRVWLAAGDFEKAGRCFHDAIALAGSIGDQLGMASHLGCLGHMHLDQRETALAEQCFNQALSLAEDSSDRKLEGRLYGSLGVLFSVKYDYEEAIKYFQQAINIAREEKDWQGEASHLGGMGIAYKFLGIVSEPEKKLISYSGEMTYDVYEYVDASKRDGYFQEAEKCFKEAIAIALQNGNTVMEKNFQDNLKEVQRLERK
jgi:tetratricopeptide (TPR) repeat protein